MVYQKLCINCGKPKLKNKGKYCLACKNLAVHDWYKKNKEKTKQRTKQWQKDNPEKRKIIQKRFRDKHKDQIKANARKYYPKNRIRSRDNNRKKFLGIGPEEIKQMLIIQNNECSICKDTIDESSHLDHNHITGKVREILCSRCNRFLGIINDNSELLKSAIKYLDKWIVK